MPVSFLARRALVWAAYPRLATEGEVGHLTMLRCAALELYVLAELAGRGPKSSAGGPSGQYL